MSEFGRLVHIDGMPRGGKSTCLKDSWEEISKRTTASSGRICLTREPGGTPLAHELRPLILSGQIVLTPFEEAYLFATTRVSSNERVVIPNLKVGNDVYKDRCIEASFAFQGAGRGLSSETVAQINHAALMDLQPLLTVIFVISYEALISRAGDSGDKFEKLGPEFFDRVRKRFLSLKNIPYYKIIDGEQSPEKVRLDFLSYLEEYRLIK